MNFLEQLLGVSPDGGSGAYELLLFVALMAVVVARMIGRYRTSRLSTGERS
jgi:hypothetical protein